MGATTAEPLAIFPLPVDRRPGRDMDFCWQRCPFLTGLQYEDGTIDYAGIDLSEPTQEGPGIDFLLSYWMTAYLGV
jgi:hypothetical protein